MKLRVIFIVASLLSLLAEAEGSVRGGAERLDLLLPQLVQKRVGLVANQTSLVGEGTHLLDTLLACGVRVAAVFAPEHGFRGDADAGETVRDGRDAKTGVPLVSLYGKNKRPTAEQLKNIDVLLFDIQDVGVRFFTYISTLHYVMEAAALHNKEVVVADRPNPNDYVDGPVLVDSLRSFVGMHPIPVLHGLTVGELAQMINGEGWLAGRRKARLTVIPVEGWKHGDAYELPVKPSPNLPNSQAVRLYASLCLFEATTVSVGRGTPFPFQVYGYPDTSWGSFSFTPQSLPGYDKNPVLKGQRCYGIDLRESTFEGGFTLRFFIAAWQKAGGQPSFFDRPQWFDRLLGTSEVRKALLRGATEQELRRSWQPELERYRKVREKYLMY